MSHAGRSSRHPDEWQHERDSRYDGQDGAQSAYSGGYSQYEEPQRSSGGPLNCKCCENVCTRRGVLKLAEILVSLMTLICVAASQASMAGHTAMGGLNLASSSINNMPYSPFQGTEMQQVQELDRAYSQMRSPAVYGGVAVCISLFCMTLGMLVGGTKRGLRGSRRWVIADFVFSVLAFVLSIVGVALYLTVVINVNATDTCKKRERVYAGRGYTWMNCSVQGGDAATALFGIILAILYVVSAVFAALKLCQFQRHEGKARAVNGNGGGESAMPMTRSPKSSYRVSEPSTALCQSEPPSVPKPQADRPRRSRNHSRENDLYV
ncbi:unnamed protein product [Lampetra fluviatilis]